MTTQPKYAIIAAGGSGLRLGADMPKQFLLLNDKPLLWYSMQAFYQYDPALKILLVLPANHIDTWKELRDKYQLTIPHTIVEGGEERFHSVKNAIELLGPHEGLVAIHDGARPFVSASLIEKCYEAAEQYASAIPAVAVKDTLRQRINGNWEHVDRTQFRAIQTPQTFNLKLLWQAYRQPYQLIFTDDASVFEALGQKVQLVDGEHENIKVTTPDDLKLGQIILQKKA